MSQEIATKMTEPTPSTTLAKRNSDTALMPPPPQPKRIKRPNTVLDEDVYTDALSHIIARDYFPALLESHAQHEYLEALDSNNDEWIREAGRKLTQAMTPGPDGRRGRKGTSMTPGLRRTTAGSTPGRTPAATPRGWTGATPMRAPSSTTSVGEDGDLKETKKPDVDLSLSLSAFQTKYTSEDNESFDALLDRQNTKRAEKYAFFHSGNKILAPRQIAHRKREQKLLQTRADAETSNAVVLRPSADQDARPASYDSFPNRSGPRNTLMFAPDGIEDTHTTISNTAQERSNAPPKSVAYTATRLPNPDAHIGDHSIPPSPSMSAIDAAIAGRPRETETESGYSGAETPRVNGYAFVDAEPTPSEVGLPVTDEAAELAEREAAMALMPKIDEDKNPFKLQSQCKREELHHRLVDQNDLSRRKGAAGGGGGGDRLELSREGGIAIVAGKEIRTPTPSFANSAKGNLTPAARMLAARIGRTPGRESSVFDGHSRGRERKTPTPGIRRSAV